LKEYIDGWVHESKKDKKLTATEHKKKYLSDETVEGLHITGTMSLKGHVGNGTRNGVLYIEVSLCMSGFPLFQPHP
jgi:hypothetical protein